MPPHTPSTDASRTTRLLLADDDPLFRRLAVHKFAALGLPVDEAGDGLEAIDAVGCTDDPFGVVILDVDMPEMDGIITHRLLREHGYAGPIVALTGTDSNAMRRLCLEMGFDAYLIKPAEDDGWGDILATIEQQLNHAPADPTGRTAPPAAA